MTDDTTRFTASERVQWRKHQTGGGYPSSELSEPALGTLEERLTIINMRQGGRRQVRLTATDKREYISWLKSQGLPIPERYQK